jgi:hypothetical protein
MSRVFMGAVAGMCFACGMAAQSQSWADSDDSDGGGLVVYSTCPMPMGHVIGSSEAEAVPPGQIPGLSLREAEGWTEPAVEKYGYLRQERRGGESTFGFVFLSVLTAKNPATLRAVFDHDHRDEQSSREGASAGISGVLVTDENEDYRGRPSWLTRTRTESLPCLYSDYTARDVLVERGGKTYLVQIRGSYGWNGGVSDTDKPDPGLADEVADQAANGLDIGAD